jgi:hypothetical protein
MVGVTRPASRRDRAGWVMSAWPASSTWDRPRARRRSRTARPEQVGALGLGPALAVVPAGCEPVGDARLLGEQVEPDLADLPAKVAGVGLRGGLRRCETLGS